MTEPLYYQDVNNTEFTAQVVHVLPEARYWKVALDRTCFYPGGGGQPPDLGFLDQYPVMDVQEEEPFIYHLIARETTPPWHPGQIVCGKIDTLRRFDYMQQHTGQHVISAAFWKIGGFHTLSVHMGSNITTIEIDTPNLSEEELEKVETLANQIILQNVPVTTVMVEPQDIHQYPLRKPPKREGALRLVLIQNGGIDCVACGGLHVQHTHQLQLIKAIGLEKIRGNTRSIWKIGTRAVTDYRTKDHIITRLKTLLSTHEERMENKISELLQQLTLNQQAYNGLENKWLDLQLSLYIQQAQRFPGCDYEIFPIVCHGEEESFVKKVAKSLLKREKSVLCVLNVFPDRVMWIIGCSGLQDFPFERITKEVLPLIEGKGGGRFPFWQGSGTKPGHARQCVLAFSEVVQDILCPKEKPITAS